MKRTIVIVAVMAGVLLIGWALMVAASNSTTSSTTTTALSTTSTPTSTTSTSSAETTSTSSSPATTFAPPPPGNEAPTATITKPAHLSKHWATYDESTGRFGATLEFVATVGDPDGDAITVEWFSSIEGHLGNGATITVTIHTQGSDSTQPFITVRVTDQWGQVTEDTIQIVVSIPSDT